VGGWEYLRRRRVGRSSAAARCRGPGHRVCAAWRRAAAPCAPHPSVSDSNEPAMTASNWKLWLFLCVPPPFGKRQGNHMFKWGSTARGTSQTVGRTKPNQTKPNRCLKWSFQEARTGNGRRLFVSVVDRPTSHTPIFPYSTSHKSQSPEKRRADRKRPNGSR